MDFYLATPTGDVYLFSYDRETGVRNFEISKVLPETPSALASLEIAAETDAEI